ncbi:MAG: hypothetical protein JOZ51_04685 [Chloroflexi bacterium]|nr:hypothetical protein [Chloroflexota bacterium]
MIQQPQTIGPVERLVLALAAGLTVALIVEHKGPKWWGQYGNSLRKAKKRR